MPAKSKKQQRAFGAALAARRGEMPVNKLKGSAKKLYYSKMTNAQLKDYAETKTKGLPMRVKNKKIAKAMKKASFKKKGRGQ